jgi:F-type H+-transporting ATPase subunit delta
MERTVGDQLRNIKQSITGMKDYGRLLTRVSLIKSEGIRFIETLNELLGLTSELMNFLDLLLKNKRLNQLIGVCDAYEAYLDKLDGRKLFFVTFAKKATKTQESRLVKDLKDLFGEKIDCQVRIDPSLMGGIQVQHRSKILDYSVKSRLNRLRSAMRKENYEN